MMARRPPYSIPGGMSASVVAELECLLARARRGDVIGFAYVAITPHNDIDGGSAGNLGRDMLKAAGALYLAASAAGKT